jgi:hypothetical protein
MLSPIAGAKMKRNDFESVSINELWALHEEIGSLLAQKIAVEKRELQIRLDALEGYSAGKESTQAISKGLSQIPEPRAAGRTDANVTHHIRCKTLENRNIPYCESRGGIKQ